MASDLTPDGPVAGGWGVIRWELVSVEEGTPAVDAYLGAGWEPFCVVLTPVTVPETEYIGGTVCPTGRDRVVGHVNVIWLRRVRP